MKCKLRTQYSNLFNDMKSKIASPICILLAYFFGAEAVNSAVIESKQFVYNGIEYDLYTYDKDGKLMLMPDGTCTTTGGKWRSPGNRDITGALVIPSTVVNPKDAKSYTVTMVDTYSFASDESPHYSRGNYITSVTIPNTVTKICEGAFDMNPITKVVIGNNVELIGQKAFRSSTSESCDVFILAKTPPLFSSDNFCGPFGTTIHVPYGSKDAYQQSSGWKEFNNIINDADVVIDDEIIYQYDPIDGTSAIVIGTTNPNITSVSIKPSITTISGKVLPVTEIGASAFYDHKNLQTVLIPDGVLTIGNRAFRCCSNLKTLSLGNTVSTIGEYAFAENTKLEFLGIPSSVKRIELRAFNGNNSLEYVMLGKGLTFIGDDAFYGCTNLSEVELEDIASWCLVNKSNAAANPMYYSHGFSIRGIKQTSLTIPSGVESITTYSFTHCTEITSLALSPSVNIIGREAFSNSGLKRIDGTMNVTAIADAAFMNCKDLEYVVLSENMDRVRAYAFANCASLKTVLVEKCLTLVGTGAFAGCRALTTIDVGDGLGIIDISAFSNCNVLTSVNTSSISGWCSQQFADKESNPLYYAKKLTLNDEEVNNLKIEDNVKVINDYAFINCESLQTAVTGNGVESIGTQAFAGCTNLNELSIGDHVKTIDNDVCNGASNLSTVTFGAEVSSIGSNIFIGCSNLRSVVALMHPAPLQTETCFEDVAYDNATLYVLPSSYATYRITQPWSRFRTIREYDDTSSIEDITIDDNSVIDVYDVNGSRLFTKVTVADLHRLDSGIYIIRYSGKTKKLLIR